MHIIELSDYSIPSGGLGNGLKSCFFTAEKGDIWRIKADNINDSHLLINGIATLAYPTNGNYFFKGQKLDFSDYRNLLPTKKRIGYLTSNATLISNRTIRENLILHKVYFDNNLSAELNETEMEMCRLFKINEILDVRPAELKVPDIKRAILTRELLKKTDVMIIEFPDEFTGYHAREDLIFILKKLVRAGVTLLYSSHDHDFIKAFSHKTIFINNGRLEQTPAVNPV